LVISRIKAASGEDRALCDKTAVDTKTLHPLLPGPKKRAGPVQVRPFHRICGNIYSFFFSNRSSWRTKLSPFCRKKKVVR
jgi:hypothetical protein